MNKYWTGIGSRETPAHIGFLMTNIASYLETDGWILRSGGADGADLACEKGIKNSINKEIYLPWKGFNNSSSNLYLGNIGAEDVAEALANRIHPAFLSCSQGTKKLHTRNCYQVKGKDLDTCSSFIIAWTKNGESKGGTRTAIEIAKECSIPIYNLYDNHTCYKMMRKIGLKNLFYSGQIEELNNNEVFVFGSNLDGFSGAGSAGWATFNKPGNIWREEGYDKRPNGWKGCWNEKGVGEGFQEGNVGKSYALPTVIKAGAKKSRTIQEISDSVETFYQFALDNPQYWFMVAYSDDGETLNGYSTEEFMQAFTNKTTPINVVFHESIKKYFQ